MNFEWKMPKDGKTTFEEKVHNLACFEIVLNILRMKAMANDEDINEEMQALCGFALECMFGDTDLEDDDMFNNIMQIKDKKVNEFRATLLEDMGAPAEEIVAHGIGEA